MLVPKLRFKAYNDEWKCKLFGQVFEFIQNNSFSRDVLNYSETSKIYNIHYGDILTKYGEVIDFNLASNTIPRINNNISLLKFEEKSYLKDGDVIISDTAEDLTVGKACEIVNLRSKALAGLHTIPCRPKLKFASYYLGEYINSNSYHSQLIPYITGIKVSSISKSNIIKTKICFPSIQEQEKISRLLGLLNKKIELQQRKIETLKMYKRGLSHKLFTEIDCNEIQIKDLGTVVTGTTPSKSKTSYWNNGTITWVTPSDITESKNIFFSDIRLTCEGLKAGRYLPANTLLVTCIASIGKNAILKVDGSCNQQINAIIPKSVYDVDFLYYLFETKKNYMQSIAGTSATSIINKTEFEKISLKIPSPKIQKSISNILSLIDEKIEKHCLILQNLSELKHYLLQQMFI